MSKRRAASVIPTDRLPAGFADQIGRVPDPPAVPLPAATAVLLRDGKDGVELLLLKRHRSSGFVPGAYVFPGGRVDAADGSDALRGMSPNVPGEPPVEYWMATVREVFEETGVLIARNEEGRHIDFSSNGPLTRELRERLMTDRADLADVLTALGAKPDFGEMAYAAHWITPVVEPRRYDTRFFYAILPAGAEATADPREMSDARWLTPAAALDEFERGNLPMVFPTVRTIEDLLQFSSTGEALAAARSMTVKPIMPSLVRVPGGVGLVIDDDKEATSD